MKKQFLRSISVLFALCLAACNPGHAAFNDRPTDGPPEYKQGWEDGCESGLGSSYTNSYYKTFYSYKKDPRMITNKWYSRGWDLGNRYCRNYQGTWVKWGYFDAPGGSLRDANSSEQSGFTIPGWNGVDYSSGIPTGVFGAPNDKLLGDEKSLDTFMGW